MIADRLIKLRAEMAALELDWLILTGAANRYYLSGFTGDHGVLVIGHSKQLLFTDYRYIEQAASEASGYTVERGGLDLLPEAGRWLAGRDGKRIGYEPAHLNLLEYRVLDHNLSERLIAADGLVERLRVVKEQEEIGRIAAAAAISDRAWDKVRPFIKPGAVERDLAAEFEYQFRREGADGAAFPTIVASGPRGALPHGTASEKKLAPGELVVCDFGAYAGGYCSDMTRTVALEPIGDKEKEIYHLVLAAQTAALAAIRPGLTCREVDAVARKKIETAGYGGFFGHGLGHSVGVEIHENPRLAPTDETVLRPGMVVTVEPGIYLPGVGGVRIEDLVVVTDDGYRNLTRTAKELILV